MARAARPCSAVLHGYSPSSSYSCPIRAHSWASSLLLLSPLLLLLASCATPNAANIQLRKTNQHLEARIDQLTADLSASQANIAGLEQRIGTLPTLPTTRLATLFTTHAIDIGRLTGGAKFDSSKPYHQGLKVYLTPLDENGDALKATGRLLIEAYTLSESDANRIGHWELSPAQLKPLWRGLGSLHAFVAELPWQTTPRHPEIILKIRFQDDLTARLFSAVREVKVTLPPTLTTQPTPQP